MNKNKKSKEMSNILIVALILVALLSIWNTVDIYNFKDIFKKGFQLNGMHWECEREYDTTKKIGCDGRCDTDKCDLEKICDIAPESCDGFSPFWTYDLVSYKVWNYPDSNDATHCFELKECGCEITWKYEKACIRDILVRDK